MGRTEWEAGRRRLRLSGCFEASDRDAVDQALASADPSMQVFIVDLTAVDVLATEVAEVIAASCDRLAGCRVTVLRRHGSEVDLLLGGLGR